ncbi:uncharacterized protein V1477_009584 [Vespula maculifrons]|uniref:Uncharacterized protein n=2 Tax=Vespula TaxID=7451 RepID=A0A834K3A8_VESGE|nr:uncharacterized protein LOC122630645 isoform X3 [Vespula pensylvanica]XP_050852598.1 uncharacterized protein LOC127064942 isoform X3 [Vespula vulgaris]KAF7399367.1 hypothetical protein HZH68_007959 [Vespula germanica]
MSTSKSSSLLRLNQESRHITDDWQTRETDSEISDNDFITKGAFLLTPSHDFNIEKAAAICEKMNFRGAFSLTKTATGILFKFSNTDDYHAVYKKGFHKITGARFYKKIAIPCRPAKTFTVYVLDVPEELPEDDIRHALFKYRSIVEVTRVPLATGTVLKAINDRLKNEAQTVNEPATIYTGPPVIRVTLASLEETTILLSQGLDFYGATYFPTDTPFTSSQSLVKYKSNRWNELSSVYPGQRVRDLLPVFDNTGFDKIPPPTSRMIKPPKN